MPNLFVASKSLMTDILSYQQAKRFKAKSFESNQSLPISLTKAASQQTYYTIKFLVDRDRVLDAFRAYAYFRWVDDQLDEAISEKVERMAFIERQEQLIDGAYCGEWPRHLSAEECMLKDLIQNHPEPDSGLAAYIRYMMAVMAFDADRRGRLISQQELADYSCNLAIAVTEALHYFIGYKTPSPQSESRYLAVTGAHITHMLRDTYQDIVAGYFNIPYEFLEAHRLDPCDVSSDGYREWVKTRVQLARSYFEAGKNYLAQVKTLRCRMAGYAYTARFENVLDAIEQNHYQLQPLYSERKSARGQLRMSWFVLSMLINELVGGA
jgi:phytoene/squalene synthetase